MDLRSCIDGCSEETSNAVVVSIDVAASEINDFYVEVVINKNVLRFEIPVGIKFEFTCERSTSLLDVVYAYRRFPRLFERRSFGCQRKRVFSISLFSVSFDLYSAPLQCKFPP